MKRSMMAVFAGMGLTGCAGFGDGPLDGVWMFEVPHLSADGICETTRETNLRVASLDAPATDWTTRLSEARSDQRFFARIAQGVGDEAMMLVDGDIVPGIRLDADTWEFTRLETETIDQQREHASGYAWSARSDRTDARTYTVVRGEKGSLTGTFSLDSAIEERWTESDRWDYYETGLYYGELPSQVVGGATNYAEDNDCTDRECTIRVATDCAASTELRATRTGLDADVGFEAGAPLPL